MITIGWMLTRMIFTRFVMLLAGISIFFITLNVFTYADEVLALNNNDLGALGTYGMLLLPSTVSTFLAMCVLLSSDPDADRAELPKRNGCIVGIGHSAAEDPVDAAAAGGAMLGGVCISWSTIRL